MLVNYFCGVADRLKSLVRLAQVTGPTGSNHQLLRASRQPFCPHLLVLQVPNILRLVVDRDRLNLGVM